MVKETVEIRTDDGLCRTQVFTPMASGANPAVILFMDGFGIRPTIERMAQRLADNGYLVLLPDLYYRAGPYNLLVPAEIFASGDVMGAIGHLYSSTDNRRAARDVAFLIEHLDRRDDVRGKKIGTTGYCMGGGMSLSAAGSYPDRVAAAASFHGGMLATDAPDSPHLLASSMAGRIYVAGADDDDYYPPQMAARLERSLSDASVDHRCEIYEGALHGFTMDDFPVYQEAAAERHWRELLNLYKDTLR